MPNRLYRSRKYRILGGVCGGIAEYFGVSPTSIRILTVILSILPGIGLLSYLLAWVIIPEEP